MPRTASLAHAVAFAVTLWLLPDEGERGRAVASPCLLAATLFVPGGFLLGGLVFYDGDPGLGIALLPIGALGLLWFVLKRRRMSAEERILKRFQARVAGRFGKEVIRTSCGLTELAEQLKSLPCREFARIYQQAVFRDRPLRPDERKKLEELIRTI